MRGTGLRKHVATISVALDLSENDVSDLAKHMGHAVAIHKEIYRQPVISRDIIRMSQVLEKAQGVNTTDGNNRIDSNDENEENSITEEIRSSYESLELSTTSNSSPSLNVINIRQSKKNWNGTHKNRKRSVNEKNLSNEADMETSHEVIDDQSKRNNYKSAKKRNST